MHNFLLYVKIDNFYSQSINNLIIFFVFKDGAYMRLCGELQVLKSIIELHFNLSELILRDFEFVEIE